MIGPQGNPGPRLESEYNTYTEGTFHENVHCPQSPHKTQLNHDCIVYYRHREEFDEFVMFYWEFVCTCGQTFSLKQHYIKTVKVEPEDIPW